MANTFKFGNGNWAVKDGYALAYNDEKHHQYTVTSNENIPKMAVWCTFANTCGC